MFFMVRFVAVLLMFTLGAAAQGSPQEFNQPIIRAQLRPINHAVISAGLSARILMFDHKVGESVVQGQLIMRFDCHKQNAEFEITQARLNVSREQLKTNQRLQELDSISNINLSLSKAEVFIAESERDRVQAVVSECEVSAPFTGKIVEKRVQAHEHVQEGDPLFRIVDVKNLEVQMVIPSSMMTDYQPGKQFQIVIDETGTSVTASVNRMIGIVDPVSETTRVISDLIKSHAELLPGMSGNTYTLNQQ